MRSLLVVAAIVLMLPAVASAQTVGASMSNTSSFSIGISPRYPAPYSNVSVTLSSSSLDLSSASMTAYVNGTRFYSGPVTTFSVPIEAAGSVVTIKVDVSANGSSYTQTTVVQPQDVALIAEPISSAPALYPGKPLVPIDGNTRVVAVANIRDASGKVIDPSKLSYDWVVDNDNMLDQSGIGRDSLLVASPLEYRDRTVSVTVQNQTGTLVGGDTLTLVPSEPTVRIYQDDPLLGVRFDHALSSLFTMTGSETSFFGAMFSLPLAGRTADTSAEWSINGSKAQTGDKLTLRSSGSGQGSASLMFQASIGYAAQAQATLPISFGSPQTSNALGL